jgi:hypothetical protein
MSTVIALGSNIVGRTVFRDRSCLSQFLEIEADDATRVFLRGRAGRFVSGEERRHPWVGCEVDEVGRQAIVLRDGQHSVIVASDALQG